MMRAAVGIIAAMFGAGILMAGACGGSETTSSGGPDASSGLDAAGMCPMGLGCSCRSNTDCESALSCVYRPDPSCSALGACQYVPDSTLGELAYCACDGTKVLGPTQGAHVPVRSEGDCPVSGIEAGSDAAATD